MADEEEPLFVTQTADIAEKARSQGFASFASMREPPESTGASAISVVAK